MPGNCGDLAISRGVFTAIPEVTSVREPEHQSGKNNSPDTGNYGTGIEASAMRSGHRSPPTASSPARSGHRLVLLEAFGYFLHRFIQIAAVAGQQPSGVIEVTEITTGEIAQSLPETDSVELSSASAATSVKAVPQTLAQASAAGDTVSADATLQGATTPDVVCLFPVNGDVIQENPQLNDLAEEVVADGSDVVITGYTDESGNAAYNQQLSDRRAKAIGDYLVAHGVPRDHISVEGRGQTHAFASNALDRRVEVRVV